MWKKYFLLLRFGVSVLALPSILFAVYLHVRNNNTSVTHHETFPAALAARADSDGYIVLAMTDEAFLDMAINFHEASLRAHDVDNFLFVGIGRKTCETLSDLSIPCFYYADDPSAGKASSYGQRDFKRKMNLRTDMILEALAANFTVIHSDTDVAFLGNPIGEIKVTFADNLSYVRVYCPQPNT